jgi:hypothetical protein
MQTGWSRGANLRAIVVAAIVARAALAAEATHSVEDAARAAPNPFFDTHSLQLQLAFTDIHAGGYSVQGLARILLAYDGLFLPGVKLGNIYSLARLEMYGEALRPSSTPSATGLQDWNMLLLGVKPFAWGAQVGLGVYSVLPTATNPALDAQEFQLGPATGFMITHVRRVELGALVDFSFSVAGTTPGMATAQLQPIVIWHVTKPFFFKTDAIMKLDLKKSPYATVPVNLHLGYALTSRLVLSGIVEGVTTGSGLGNVTAELNLNYVGW